MFGNNDTDISNYTIDSIDDVGNVEAFNTFDTNEYNETKKKVTQAIDSCGNEPNGDSMLINLVNLGYHFETDEVSTLLNFFHTIRLFFLIILLTKNYGLLNLGI